MCKLDKTVIGDIRRYHPGRPCFYDCLCDCYNSFNTDDIEIRESYSEGTLKAAAYADDLTAGGCIPGLMYWWDQFCELGP